MLEVFNDMVLYLIKLQKQRQCFHHELYLHNKEKTTVSVQVFEYINTQTQVNLYHIIPTSRQPDAG